MSEKKSKPIALFILLFLMIPVCSQAQTLKDLSPPTNRMYIDYGDSLAEVYYYREDKIIKTKEDRFYYWYSARNIKSTRGGYEGRVLHGEYLLFYHNRDLNTKGFFKYGLKNGKWESWYPGGEIKSRQVWKKGLLHGKVRYYNTKGKLLKEETYKKGQLNGWSASYANPGDSTVSKTLYSKGELKKETTYAVDANGKKKKTEKVKNKKVKLTKEEKALEKKKKGIKVFRFRQILPAGKEKQT